MVKKIKLLVVALGSFMLAQAQDSTKVVAKDSVVPSPPPSFTGSLDLYYRYNFANPKTGPGNQNPTFYNNYTSFTNSQNSFELGMAAIKYDHSWGKAGASVELGFGRRAQDFSYNDGTNNSFFSLSNVIQAYVYYNLTEKVKITAGKFPTHIGYELVDAYLNRNYSMSYMFSYGPFFNTGVKADVAIAGKTAFMVGISNSTDHSSVENFSYQSVIAQLSTATPDSKWKFFLNYQGGNVAPGTSLNQLDLVVTGALTDKFSIGLNGTEQTVSADTSATWWGAALYLNFDPSSAFGLTLRSEYFSNKTYLLALPYANYTEFTLTGNIHLGKLTVMPELRYDASSEDAFIKNDLAPTKNTFTGLIAATYTF
jgi:hypothetical protein